VSQQNQFPPPAQPYGQSGGYPEPGYQPQRTNTMAVLGLVFAFVFSPLGVVFSAIGLKQVKERREGGRGLALAGLILSIVFIVLGVILAIVLVAVADKVVEETTQAEAAAPAPDEDPTGVVAACGIIVPAVVGLESNLAGATTPEDYAAVMNVMRMTMESAAAGTTDPEFIAHVQTLSAHFQESVDAVTNGEDPSYLEAALTADGTTIDNDCAAAGYVE
jgi:hypothetical protein